MGPSPTERLTKAPMPDRRTLALAIAWTLLRILVGFALIVLILSLIPDAPDGSFFLPIGIAVLATVAYALFFRRQIRSVYRARFPTLRAAEALVLVAAMFLALFATIYVMISLGDPAAFTEELAPFNSYYFALTVLATVGFGDITPVTTLARSVTMVQMALDLVFIAVLIRVVGGAARQALERRNEKPALPATAAVLEEQ